MSELQILRVNMIRICFPGTIGVRWMYEDRAKSSVTNRLPRFNPRYILKCFTHLNGVLNS